MQNREFDNTQLRQPFLTVITVVLNNAKTIENSLKSVLNQTYTNFEYVVIDGGSTDGTLEIIQKYRDKISYFWSGSDGGIYDAMNKGIAASKGEVIYFLGSDDELIGMSCLSDMMGIYKKKDLEFLYAKVSYIDKKGKFKKRGRKVFMFDVKAGRMPSHQSMFMSKKRIVEAGMFKADKYKLAADFELVCYFFTHKVKRAYINYNVALYGENGKTSILKESSRQERSEIIRTYFGSFRSKLFVLKKELLRRCRLLVG